MGQSAAVPNQYRCPPHSALGYRKTSAVDGDQQSARPNAGLLSSAEQCAHRLPVKRSPDPSDLRRQIPGLTAPQRAESKYGREWMAQRSLTCGIQTLYRLLSLASDVQFLKLCERGALHRPPTRTGRGRALSAVPSQGDIKMRSELVFEARQMLGNRFALCQAAAKAARKFHVAKTRFEDTTNAVLQRIAESHQESVTLPADNNPGQCRLGPSEHWSSRKRTVIA